MNRTPRIFVLVAALLVSPAARADTAPLSSSLTGGARSLFESAKLLYENHDYAGAATKYRAAFDASHNPRLLWNIATCEKELRHYARAASLLERFIAAAPPVAPSTLAQARDALAALREFYSPVQLRVQPAGAHVLIDGEVVGTAPLAQPVLVDLGKHALKVEHPGHAPYEAPLDVIGKSALTIDVALKALPNQAMLVVNPSDPRDAVTVDGKIVPGGRWEGGVAPGKHRVRVTASGKKAYDVELELTSGERRSLDVTLEKEQGGAPVWPWLIGGAVALAGGTVAAIVLLKPADQPGPPPTGSMGTIYVSSAHGGVH